LSIQEDPGPRETTVHLRRALAGDSAELGWVVERLSPFVESQIRLRLGGHGCSYDLEDLVSQVWVTTLGRLETLQPRENHYTQVLVRFLGTTALHEANNFLRRLARSAPRPAASREPAHESRLVRESRDILGTLAEREAFRRVRDCLERMAPDKRDVLVLRLMEQKQNREIARILGLKPNTVAVRYRRALEELRLGLPEVYRELSEGFGASHED